MYNYDFEKKNLNLYQIVLHEMHIILLIIIPDITWIFFNFALNHFSPLGSAFRLISHCIPTSKGSRLRLREGKQRVQSCPLAFSGKFYFIHFFYSLITPVGCCSLQFYTHTIFITRICIGFLILIFILFYIILL